MKKIIKPLAVLVTSAAIVSLPVFSASAAQSDTNTTINATIDSTITITSNGTVNLSVVPTGSGAQSSASDTVRVSTNNAAGYSLALHMSTADQNLTDGSGHNIAPGSGSLAAPTALANNTWGYRIDGRGGFGAGATSAETNVANSAYTWAGIPVAPGGSPTNIVKQTSAVANNDETTVWYSVKADSSLPNGVYSGTVTYTAITR